MQNPFVARLLLGLAFLFVSPFLTAQPVYVSVLLEPVQPVTGLIAVAGDSEIALDWDDSADPEVIGYALYRLSGAGQFERLYTDPLTESEYDDAAVSNGTIYVYGVAALTQPEGYVMSSFGWGLGWRYITALTPSAGDVPDSVPAFNPAGDPRLALWFDGKVDCAPALWEDQGPLALQAAQASAPLQPAARSGGGLTFTGTESLVAPDATGLLIGDVFMVVKVSDLAGLQRTIFWAEDGIDGPGTYLWALAGDMALTSGLPALEGKIDVGMGATGFSQFADYGEANGIRVYLAPADLPGEDTLCFLRVVGQVGSPLSFAGEFNIGAEVPATTSPFVGEILEIIAFDEILSREEAIGLYEFEVAKWTLPAIPDYSGAPPAPINAVGLGYNSNGAYATIQFEVSAPTVDLLGYNLYRRTGSSGPFVKLGSDPTYTTDRLGSAGLGQPFFFQDSSATPENAAAYEYQVEALDIFGRRSTPAGPVSLAVPAAPTGLAATPGVNRIWLAWTQTSDSGETDGYNVYRSAVSNGGPWTQINGALVDLQSPYYLDDTVNPEETYWYVVTGLSAPGLESALSTWAEATTFAAIATPIRSGDIIWHGNTESGNFTLTGAQVDAWADLSAADNDFAQSSSTFKPELVDLGGGAGNVVRFEPANIDRMGTGPGLLAQDLSGADGVTLFIRSKTSAIPSSGVASALLAVYIGRTSSVDRLGFAFGYHGAGSSLAKSRIVSQATATTSQVTSTGSVNFDPTERALFSVSVKFGTGGTGSVKVRRNGQLVHSGALTHTAATWTPGGTPPTAVDVLITAASVGNWEIGPGDAYLYKGDSTDEELAQMEDLLGF